MIVATANEWSKHCGMKFMITPNEFDAQVKVSFSAGGYASAIGIECLQEEYYTKPSMYLQGLDTLKNKDEFRRIVLHEFGHILGIEHELRKPTANIPWNKDEVYKYYLATYKWDQDRVDQEIFLPLESGKKEYEEFDSTSIMVYAIGPPLTEKEYRITWPKELSKKDIECIATWYPK